MEVPYARKKDNTPPCETDALRVARQNGGSRERINPH
jgi:hypothetical protein